MQYDVRTVEEYLSQIPEERLASMQKLRETILQHLPEGFEECIGYGMIGYSVPHSIYPNGYHCNSKDPLPFAGIASQKNFIAFYHMGIYALPDLMDWFIQEYSKISKRKLDMGKSCVRFKKTDEIPYLLIGELMKKISVNEWIITYETAFKKKK